MVSKEILSKKLILAVEVMERAANQTTDPKTFQILTIGFEKIKEIKDLLPNNKFNSKNKKYLKELSR